MIYGVKVNSKGRKRGGNLPGSNFLALYLESLEVI